MSTELEPVIGTSLEDDAPSPAAAPPVAPVAAAPAEPEPVQPPEPDAVEVNGERMVPVAAVLAERQRRQDAEKRAERLPELEQWHRDAAPYVEFLKANPDFLKPKAEPAPVAPTAPTADPVLQQLAQTLDLYDAAGQPDTKRSGVIKSIIDAAVQQGVAQGVAPFQQQTATDRSNANYARALQVKDAEGKSPDPQALSALWRTMTPEDTADPRIAQILAMTALGAERMTKKAPIPVPPAAPFTEASGGHPRARPAMSAVEERVAQDRGRTPAQWSELTKGHQSGRPNTLED